MSDGFTKIYREERELLRKINTGAAYEVYMHLKDKYNYFKQDVYDYMGFMAEHLEISEITVKRTIKKLKEVGLIESKRVWVYTNGQPKSINIYSFPIVDKIEGKTADDTKTHQAIESTPIVEERQPDTQDVAKEEKQPQTTDLSDTFDNYSENLNDFLDENEQRINGWVSAISNGIVCKSNITEFPKEMAIKNIEKIITEYGTITKDALDFKEYMTERITDSIRQKRYERAVQSSYNA